MSAEHRDDLPPRPGGVMERLDLHVDGDGWITVGGELDRATAPAFAAMLQCPSRRAGEVGIDLCGVQFIDAGGINTLVAAARTLGERGRLVVRNPSPPAARLIAMTHLADVLDVIAVDRPATTDVTVASVDAAPSLESEDSDETAIAVESREELVSLLCEAAELEHGLACSYLFAAFSLKRSIEDGLNAAHVEAVNRWRQTIMDVAEEEMLHLALVCNLLTAIGAAPHLRRPPMPHRSPYYPVGVTIELRRFHDSSLTRFIFLERPEHVELEAEIVDHPAVDLEAEVPAFAPGALGVRAAGEDATTGDLATVGHLYDTIDAAFSHLASLHGERRLFIGSPQAQAASSHFDMHDLAAVTDLTSARAALETLTTQGEGVRGDWSEAHYGRFLGIREEFRQLVAVNPAFDPAWPVLDNPTEHPDGDGEAVDNPETLAVMRLFNSTYTLMTVMLLRWFAHTDENEAALRALARTCVDLMEDAIAPLGSMLAQLPAHPAIPAPTAGASFEFYRMITLIPHRGAAWLIFHERLTELATHAARLADTSRSDTLQQVGASLDQLAGRLEPYLHNPQRH